ncbi:hypothetical protein pb186bvf_015260 [Paramecium bursaria]
MKNLMVLLTSAMDLAVIFTYQHYTDKFCSSYYVKLFLIAAEKYLGGINCNTFLAPYQITSIFSFASLILNMNTGYQFMFNLILRSFVGIFYIFNPIAVLITTKFIWIVNMISLIIYGLIIVNQFDKYGIRFQSSLKQSQAIFIPILLIYGYQFYYSSNLYRILSLLPPLAQLLITEKGTIITSSLLSIVICSSSMYVTYTILIIVQISVLINGGKYSRFVGLLTQASLQLNQNKTLIIVILASYTYKLYQKRKREKEREIKE